MTVAFFDFDGTITTKDSFIDFLIYHHGKKAIYRSYLMNSMAILGFKLGWCSNQNIKERLLTYFFKDVPQKEFTALATAYAQTRLKTLLHPKALDRIHWHQHQGHEVVIVSASLSDWIHPWCAPLGIRVLASRLAIENGKLTGKLDGKNCDGIEKVRQIKTVYNLDSLTYSYAYGNSKGDAEMLSFANESAYCPFF